MKELKEVLDFALCLGNAFGESMKDGKLDYTDLINLWDPLTKAPDAVEGASKILSEIENLDAEKGKALVEYAKAKFDIPQDDVEAKVEAAMDLVLGITKFVKLLKE